MGITSFLGRLLGSRKSVGEKIWSRLLSGFGAFGLPGSWAQDRKEQVLHYKGWQYVAIRTIAEEIAALQANVGFVMSPTEYEERLGKALKSAHPSRHRSMEAAFRKKFLRGQRRTKSLAMIQDHEELEMADSDHRLVRLLRNPNGFTTGWQFWFRTVMSLDMTGTSYWWAIPDGYGLPCELWNVPSQWVWPSPIRYEDELISWYEIRPYGVPGGAGVFKIPASEMIPIQYPHPLTLWDGFSPMTAMSAWIDVLESMDACQWSTFKNQIGIDGYVELDPKAQDPTQEDVNRLISRLEQRLRFEGNFKRPVVLSPGAKMVYPKGTAPYEMDYTQGGDQKRDWVLAGWGVSKFMAGISEDVNRASAIVAVNNFIRKVIRPRLLLIDSVATERLAKMMDPGLVVYHDDPRMDDPDDVRANYQLAQTLRAVTPNEYRVNVLGLEPFEHGGDDPIGQPTDVPLPYATGQTDEADELAEALAKIQAAKPQPQAPGKNVAGLPGLNNRLEADGLPPERNGVAH